MFKMDQMNKDSNTVMEIITVYRKLKKGREPLNTTYSKSKPVFSEKIGPLESSDNNWIYNVLKPKYDFTEYENISPKKYLYFSDESKLIQSDDLFYLPEFEKLALQRNFWLNIFDPSDLDLKVLSQVFEINELSLNDIRERNTEEKIEIYKHYTFISLKLASDFNIRGNEDIDFNILIFKDFIITLHDKPWDSIKDIVNFLSLLCKHTPMHADWVFFSIIIEFIQDLKYLLDCTKEDVMKNYDLSKTLKIDLKDILMHNFQTASKIQSIKEFIRPKVTILSSIKYCCYERTNKHVLKYLNDSLKDFQKHEKTAKEYYTTLERCQDLSLALVNIEQSQEGNEMNRVMKLFTTITFIFLPCQTVSGLWGMNVRVPWQFTDNNSSIFWFWILTLSGPAISAAYFSYDYWKKSKKHYVRRVKHNLFYTE